MALCFTWCLQCEHEDLSLAGTHVKARHGSVGLSPHCWSLLETSRSRDFLVSQSSQISKLTFSKRLYFKK